jgi:ribosomal protein L7/L12
MPWYWVVGIVVLVLIVVLSRRGESTGDRPRAPRMSADTSTWTDADIDTQLRAGQKIQAIKVYRHLHGTDLKDSKDAVEARAKTLGLP